MSNNSLLDILLFPKSFYKKISDKLLTLYLGIILVGFIDMGFGLYTDIPMYFWSKPPTTLMFNISLTLCFVVLAGLIDIVFFALPLFDIFKFFRVKEKIKNINGQLIKLMKIYVVSHFLVVPVNAFFLFLSNGPYGENGSVSIISFFVLTVVTPIWHCAIVTRGINAIYSFDDRLKNAVFPLVYVWTTLLGYALGFIINNWLIVFLM
ncbi:MAG TPA: hypothetical protein PLA01_09175 [Acetivibrio sp.]|nr:hypothetical protein [Acetivibrio sp.]